MRSGGGVKEKRGRGGIGAPAQAGGRWPHEGGRVVEGLRGEVSNRIEGR